MTSQAVNPIWLKFPRWIEESGVPELLHDQCHPYAWIVFRKLIEIDCEKNLTPDDFFVRFDLLARWLGLSDLSIIEIVNQLEDQNWIELNNVSSEDVNCKITVPIKVPNSEAEIRKRMQEAGIQSNRVILRYFDNIGDMNRSEKVVYLYQMLFGLRFTPRIVEDLEEIASTYDMAVIYQTFSEAHSRNSKSLSWIRSQLGKKVMVDET